MTENWKPVVGYEGLYLVSDKGNVLSLHMKATNEARLMSQRNRRGYPSVALCKHGKEHAVTVHSMVLAAFFGPRPDGYQINHIDGDKMNAILSNLEYCTPRENKLHAFRTGLECNKGEQHSQAKLNDQKVREIRIRIRQGEKYHSIAKDYGVSETVISNIKTGRLWPHVKDQTEAKNLCLVG